MRLLKYALKNIFRNTFLSISSVLVLTLLMFFINILFVIHDVSFNIIKEINNKLSISLYLSDEYDRNTLDVTDLIQDLDDAGVDVTYKTKDVILDEMRVSEPDLAKIVERTNPLPDTILLNNIDLQDYDNINQIIESKLYLLISNDVDQEYFANYTTQYKKIQNIIGVLHILQIGLYIIIAIFLVSIAIIVYSIIGNFIYYYRDEIYITRLVGGARQFIYGPFALQGMIYSLLAYICSASFFLFVLQSVNTAFGELYIFSLHPLILLGECVLFVLIGGLSGYSSSKKYLK
ncbi:hypothetical protein MK079_02195 [Candidatus Gracilibacteria bacterium]|nr:hypothetical protein [Candidatus Gracilibacteria bacterium]